MTAAGQADAGARPVRLKPVAYWSALKSAVRRGLVQKAGGWVVAPPGTTRG
jgi:hypothetical protein